MFIHKSVNDIFTCLLIQRKDKLPSNVNEITFFSSERWYDMGYDCVCRGSATWDVAYVWYCLLASRISRRLLWSQRDNRHQWRHISAGNHYAVCCTQLCPSGSFNLRRSPKWQFIYHLPQTQVKQRSNA